MTPTYDMATVQRGEPGNLPARGSGRRCGAALAGAGARLAALLLAAGCSLNPGTSAEQTVTHLLKAARVGDLEAVRRGLSGAAAERFRSGPEVADLSHTLAHVDHLRDLGPIAGSDEQRGRRAFAATGRDAAGNQVSYRIEVACDPEAPASQRAGDPSSCTVTRVEATSG